MPGATVSSRMLAIAEEKRAVTAFTERILGDRGLGPDACDFVSPRSRRCAAWSRRSSATPSRAMSTGSATRNTTRRRARRSPARSANRAGGLTSRRTSPSPPGASARSPQRCWR